MGREHRDRERGAYDSDDERGPRAPGKRTLSQGLAAARPQATETEPDGGLPFLDVMLRAGVEVPPEEGPADVEPMEDAEVEEDEEAVEGAEAGEAEEAGQAAEAEETLEAEASGPEVSATDARGDAGAEERDEGGAEEDTELGQLATRALSGGATVEAAAPVDAPTNPATPLAATSPLPAVARAFKAEFPTVFGAIWRSLAFPPDFETRFSEGEMVELLVFMQERKLPPRNPLLGNGALSITEKILIAGAMHALDRTMRAGSWGRGGPGQQRVVRAKDCGTWVRTVWAYCGLVTRRGQTMPRSVKKTWRSPAFHRTFSAYVRRLDVWKRGGKRPPKPTLGVPHLHRSRYLLRPAFQGIRPGDWIMMDWRKGGNHSVIFVGWKRRPTGTATSGVAYTMDQNNNPIGGGNFNEYFIACEPRSGHVPLTGYVYEIRRPT